MRPKVTLSLLLLALGVLAHVALMGKFGWPLVVDSPHGRDFASYYYAVQAAAQGLDPYRTAALDSLARADGTRSAVFPYFYPPPFLLSMVWALPLSLSAAYRLWFWVDGVFAVVSVLGLWLWRRSPLVAVGGALLLASFTPWFNNHQMGQANLPVLALMVWGLFAVERQRPWLGGALVGVACMMKMSPGLIVAWWLLRREWRPAFAACALALVLSVATLPLVDFGTQRAFYLEILPSFSTGDYNGLSVSIDIFGNHSLPNLWAQLYPGPGRLSDTARLGAGLTNLALVGATFAALPRRGGDALSRLCAAGALTVVMLVVPVYTYEHHMSLMLLPILGACAAIGERRVSWLWGLALVAAYVPLAWELASLKAFAVRQPQPLRWVLQELKFFALWVPGAICVIAARAVKSGGGASV